MKKKLTALLLVFVLCLAMCPAVYAANGDLTVSAVLPGNMVVTFSGGCVSTYIANNGLSTVYYKYAQLPDTTNFSSVYLIFVYTGKLLKVNGTVVASFNTVQQRMYSFTANLTSVTTIEVDYGTSSKTYYIHAYPSEYAVSMSFEYENARAFSNLSGSTYGTSGLLDPVTYAQKETAAVAVTAMDTMCESMLPYLTASEYRTITNIIIEPSANDPSANTPYGLILKFQQARTNFTFYGNTTYIDSIGSLDAYCAGIITYEQDYMYNSGGWMYQVIRGGVTYTPMIGLEGFKLFPGDEVIWRYTCDLGYDIGCPMF